MGRVDNSGEYDRLTNLRCYFRLLASHGGTTALNAAIAAVATSIVSTTINYVMVCRSTGEPEVRRDIGVATASQAAVGIVATILGARVFH
jgi:hypothetical protein